jgi:hypothetical protein
VEVRHGGRRAECARGPVRDDPGRVTDRVVDNFRGTRAELITTNLSADQEAKLREAFEDADHAPV